MLMYKGKISIPNRLKLNKHIFYIPLTYNIRSPFKSAYNTKSTKWYRSKIHITQCKLNVLFKILHSSQVTNIITLSKHENKKE